MMRSGFRGLFWGIILRAYEKFCEELGIDKFDFKTFHQIHINKVMGVGLDAAYLLKKL